MKVHVSVSHGLVALLLVMNCLSCTEAGVLAVTQQLEVQQYLKKLNKPAVKSIKSPDGDIIDCVHISHQPAFDHSLLKNHTIQLRPESRPTGLHEKNKVGSKKKTSSIAQLWHQNGWCPEDTIPIRRTKKDDVLRASSVERYGKKRHNTIPNRTSVLSGVDDYQQEHSYAVVNGGKYYGTKATMDVWNPYVQGPHEFSNSQLWLIANPSGDADVIEAGWHVNPSLYGDNRTRVFISWTSDNYNRIGCYNLLCSGFVQVSSKMAVGSTIGPISSKSSRYTMTLLVWKEQKTKNWWLQFGQHLLGYWPSSLFNDMSDGASAVEWGGVVANSKPNGEHTSTMMGSGHFAKEGPENASYFKRIQIVDESNNLKDPEGITTAAQSPNCYDVGKATSDDHDGTYFLYGGPGKNPNCP